MPNCENCKRLEAELAALLMKDDSAPHTILVSLRKERDAAEDALRGVMKIHGCDGAAKDDAECNRARALVG